MASSYLPGVAATPLRLLLHLLILLPVGRASEGARQFNQTTVARARVPAVIVFGDSIVDPGNNNVVDTFVKCNYPPYGEDFAGHVPTGRFCNGKIPTDFIASKLGVKEYLPAYLGTDLPPEELLTGVSFASGGFGFDPLTPSSVSALSGSDQLELFEEYKERVRAAAGDEETADDIISRSLYVVCGGNNDLTNNYFFFPIGRRQEYDFSAYANFLATSAASFIEDVVKAGARRVGVVGMPPVGCLPAQRTLGGGIQRDCDSDHNLAAELYNSALQAELRRLTSKLRPATPSVELTYIDIYTILMDIILQPDSYGFEEASRGCCGTGEIEVLYLCNSITAGICEDRSKYVFWDGYHPTEKTYQIIVDHLIREYYSD